ncbi:MAG TPA: PQQ-binding-like beta-propeller repeat protein, partial [Chthonomonadales bacterium]|nr:PQQ-binding-like beta-propeller repeat protein [Chthonomonadales bacterium]
IMGRLNSLSLLIVSLIVVYLTVDAGAQKRAPAQSESFSFLDISDTHETASSDPAILEKFVSSAAAMSPPPAFVIDTGDITESGRPEEYERFKRATAGLQAAGIGFYAIPGNHDVRWSPDGKEGFQQQFGKLYQSFNAHGVHFILLDSTVVLEHWGHFDKAELDWLRGDLKKVRSETPIFVFMHHPIGRAAPETRFIDNEFDLRDLLRGHNVVAIFTGHEHQDLVWKTDGILTLMPRGLYQGSFYRVSVTPAIVSIDRIMNEQTGSPVHIASIPVSPGAKPSQLKAGWDDPDIPFLERRRPACYLDPRAVTDNPDKEKAEYRIDSGSWKPMKKDARDVWSDQFGTAGIAIGVHSADLRLTTSNGIGLEDELIFEVERAENEATRRWAVNLDGPIQSSPLLDGDRLYVSSLDGKLYAFRTDNGKKIWSFASKGEFLASPVLDNGVLYIGSTDHFVYAVDTRNGKQVWRYDAGCPILASAAAAHGTLCLGVEGRILGLDSAHGTLRWSQPAGSFFQSRAATDGSTFYLGGWDNTFYALDVETGNVRWKDRIGRAFYFSPAIASPLVAGGRVYVCSNDDTLQCLNTTDGKPIWTAHAPDSGDVLGYSSPALANGRIFIAGLGDRGDVYAFDASTGAFRWQSPIGHTIYDSSPKIAPDGRSLAIMAVRGHVAVLSTSNGAPEWTYELGPGNIFSTPEYDGSTVYTVTMANDVQAINAPRTGSASP